MMATKRRSKRNRSELQWFLMSTSEYETRVREVLMHKYRYTRSRADAVIGRSFSNGSFDTLKGGNKSPSQSASYMYCRSGPQPTGVRAAVERVAGPKVKSPGAYCPTPFGAKRRGRACGCSRLNRACSCKARR